MVSADVVVIGAGASGAAASYFLSRAGLSVITVEAQDVAAGTTSACASGVILQTKPSGQKLELAFESLTLWRDLAQRLGPSIEFQQDGSLLVAEDEEQWEFLQAKAQKASASQVPVDILSAEEVRARYPHITPTVTGATYCPPDATVNPYQYAFALMRQAQAHGATLQAGTKVLSLTHKEGTVTDVVTDKGRISTGLVVSTAGPWTSALLEPLGQALPLSPRKGELLVSVPMPPLFAGAVISASYLLSKALPKDNALTNMTAGLYSSWSKRGNLIIGSTREFAGFDRGSSPAGLAALVRGASQVLPFVKRLKFLRGYAGLRPASSDGFPIISRLPQFSNVIVATGHEGDGISLSPITGTLVTALALQTDNLWLAKTSLSRFDGRA